ncbi:MAG: LysE family transporter [Elusimicrobia bacterium]|nr:LysE family transporter [Elusimicrobiota bacterium]
MSFTPLLRGTLVGFLISIPVGPISILCMRRTLAKGRLFGFISGLGAATADALYGGIAGFGLTLISDTLASQQSWIRLIGGVFLCYLGVLIFRDRPHPEMVQAKKTSLIKAYAEIFFLTLTNPMTILSFAAVFAGMGIANLKGNFFSASLLVLGVFLGSALWWFLLSQGMGALRAKINAQRLLWINRISGAIIAGFGLLTLRS